MSIVYFGPDNAGSITTLRVAVLEAPKIGDYLYSDGTWSDGGLISIGSESFVGNGCFIGFCLLCEAACKDKNFF